MAVRSLTSDPQTVFRNYVLANVQYWRDFVTVPEVSPPALERGRQRIITALRFAFDLDEAWPHTAALISAFSTYMEWGGHWSAWQGILMQAIEAARTAGDGPAEVEFSVLLARLLFRQAQTEAAIRQYRRTITLARRARDRYNQARSYTNLGYLFVEAGDWWRAEILCCAALRIFEQLDNQHGQAHTHNHLGVLYTRQYNWEAAQPHLERACTLWQAMADAHGLMFGYLNLSLLYAEAERSKESLFYSEKALKQANLTGETSQLGSIYLNMSYAYRLNGEPTQAEKYARQAETLYRQFSNTRYLASAWVNLGEALLDQNQVEKARPYLESALTEFQALNYAYGEIRGLLALIKYGRSTAQLDRTNIWVTAAESRIAQLSGAAQRRHFQMLLERYQHA